MKDNTPSNSNSVWDKVLDVVLEESSDVLLEQLNNDLPQPEENIEFSAEHERKMNRLFRRERLKLTRKKAIKYTKVAAVVLVGIILCTGISIASVSAWRAQFMNYILDLSQPNTDFTFNEAEKVLYENDKVKIKYAPDGFELTDCTDNERRLLLDYNNGELFYQVVIRYSTTMNTSIDTENGIVRNTTLNGYEAVYASTSLCNSLIWSDGKYVYTVCGDVEEREIFKIAENIQKIK